MEAELVVTELMETELAEAELAEAELAATLRASCLASDGRHRGTPSERRQASRRHVGWR